ncbi:M12 family metallopeptidase [Devosia sp.]|uniref:M12 family metallopeptidase n=1 Tax=Devosia sp. TaxID=1871048 RepID=UPI003265A557
MKLNGVVAALVFAIMAGPALAHDLPGLVGDEAVLDDDEKATLEQIDAEEAEISALLAKGASTVGLEGIMDSALVWRKDVLTACFFAGSAQSARNAIAGVAADWTTGTRLSFDFGPEGNRRQCDPAHPSDIRIAFKGGNEGGEWSRVGAEAKLVKNTAPTMNFEGLDQIATASESQRGTILHEFGHAIGFKHEHQSIAADCDKQFNWDYLYTQLGWTKKVVDHNMAKLSLATTKTLIATPFDRQSIMLYSLNRGAFLDPDHASCYIPRQTTRISAVDRALAQQLYAIADGNIPDGAPPEPNLELLAPLNKIAGILGE